MREPGEDPLSKPDWAETSLCPDVILGSLSQQPVLLVTTGIGHDRAALCLSDVRAALALSPGRARARRDLFVRMP